MKLFIVPFLLITCYSFSQCDTNRYKLPVFSTVFKHLNVKYGTGQVWNIPYNNTDLFMDVYEPNGDVLAKRPLMLWVHPGGFLVGTKEAEDMVALCDSFAKRGYVTASIEYRMGFNPLSSTSAERAVYRGTQDIRAAIRYFKEYATVYHIDTTAIFLGGSSAGGFAALHVAYLDQDEAPASIVGDFFSPNLGCLDCSGNTYNHTSKLRGIVNLWGALGDSSFVDIDETTPALLVHGKVDNVVSFGVGHPFGVFTTPITHGSRCVSNRLMALGIPHTKLFFEGQSHEPHGTSNGDWNNTPPTPYWDTIFYAIQQHYFNLLKPAKVMLSGDVEVCLNDTVEYTLPSSNQAVSTCWTVIGGQIIQQQTTSITIYWNQQGNGSIRYVQFSDLNAASSAVSQVVHVNTLPDATFSTVQNGATVSFSAANQVATNYTWHFSGLGSSTSSNPTFTFPSNGNYNVQLTVQGTNSCKASSSQLIYIQGLGLGEEMLSTIRVYPNPVSTAIFVEGVAFPFDIVVNDQLGRTVFTERNIQQNSIALEHLSTGIYTLGIYSATESVHFTIVKE